MRASRVSACTCHNLGEVLKGQYRRHVSATSVRRCSSRMRRVRWPGRALAAAVPSVVGDACALHAHRRRSRHLCRPADRIAHAAERAAPRPPPLRAHRLSNRAGSVGVYDDEVLRSDMQSSQRKLFCWDPFDALYVLFDGTVITCCADWRRRAVIGDLSRETIAEVWSSEPSRARRRMSAGGRFADVLPCSSCHQAANILTNLERLGQAGA